MIGNVGGARPVYYDRGPATKSQNYSNDGVAPHGNTQRWVYTVPTGKKTYVQSARAHIIRQTAAAPVGLSNSAINVTTTDANVGALSNCKNFNNVIGIKTSETFGGVGMYTAGNVIELLTSDASTGGTQSYSGNMTYVEFDA